MEDVPLPDPITDYARKLFDSRYRRRERFIAEHHPGFNLVYWRRILRTPARLARWGRHLGWSEGRIRLDTALLVSRMACMFIDHIIRRMEQTEILPPGPGRPHHAWEDQYQRFLLLFLQQTEVPDREEIVALMRRLHRYTSPPPSLLRFRGRHWRLIDRTLQPHLSDEAITALTQWRIPPPATPPAVAARHICLAASLHADLLERLHGQQWSFAYSDFMLRRYPLVHIRPALLAAIIGVHLEDDDVPAAPPGDPKP